jgi:phosphate transport system substrate-binding protein
VRLKRINRSGFWTVLFAIFAVGSLWSAHARASSQTLDPIRKIYVEPFQGKLRSAELHDKVVESLKANSKFQIVDNQSDADAVVQGSGEIWVEGYVSSRPHSSAREAVYGGYLSLEVKSRNGETLWSYLVTPSRMHWGGVAQDMANHIVKLMVTALAQSGTPSAQAATTLTGAGSTFAAPLYQDWIESFEDRRPEVHTTYQAVGSEEGIQLLKEGRVDFAASDVPLSDEQMADMHTRIENIATVLGGVVPAYNLPGVGRDLRFTPEILAKIYLGKITNWNDPELRAINHGPSLPDKPIIVVHRAEGSGTSFIWTSFLSSASTEWKSAVGTGMRVNWPTGEPALGNEGVAVKVAETPDAIGYVELTYAIRHELSFGLVRNAAGKFVQANLATLSAAAESAPQTGDLRASLVDAPGNDAYPITTFTWILLPVTNDNPQKSAALRDLLRWMLTSGQKECSGLGYLPLPKEIADRELPPSSPDMATNPKP